MIDFAILQEAIPLVVIFGLVTSVCAYLLVYANVKLWLRALLIPLILALTFVGYITLVDVLGKPYPGLPPDQTKLIHYIVDIRTTRHNTREKVILLWVYNRGDHRLYRVPYSRKLELELIASDEDARKGKPRKLIGRIGLEPDSSPIKMYEIPWKDSIPKDPVPGE